jgi:hypothetical protein
MDPRWGIPSRQIPDTEVSVTRRRPAFSLQSSSTPELTQPRVARAVKWVRFLSSTWFTLLRLTSKMGPFCNFDFPFSRRAAAQNNGIAEEVSRMCSPFSSLRIRASRPRPFLSRPLDSTTRELRRRSLGGRRLERGEFRLACGALCSSSPSFAISQRLKREGSRTSRGNAAR